MNNGFGYISSEAVISNALIAPNVCIYGKVTIGSGVIIGPGVILGHPSPSEQIKLKQHLVDAEGSYHDFVDTFVETETFIGERAVLRSGTVVYSGTRIESNADIAHNCLIREDCFIGKSTHIITGTQVMGSVHIGHECRIAGTLCNRTRIGNCSSVLGHVMHRYKIGLPGHIESSPVIGNGVIIGRESSIIGDIEIGDYAIVGAGSVVTKSVPSAEIWFGNPATQQNKRESEKYIKLMEKVKAYEV